MEVVPPNLLVNIEPNLMPMGNPAQFDVVNTSNTAAIDSISMIISAGSDLQPWVFSQPCPDQIACSGAPFAIAPTMSRPVTFKCPNLPPNTTTGRMITVTAHYTDGSILSDTLNVTCTSLDIVAGYASNVVFPTTEVGKTSTGMIRVSSGYTQISLVTADELPSDPTTFEITSCKTGLPQCMTSNMSDASINVSCHPVSAGPHFATVLITAATKTTQSTLVCNGTGMAIPSTGDDAGPDGDGGMGRPDGGSGPNGNSNGTADPQSFYACSTMQLAGMLPVLVALVLVLLRRR